MKDKYEHSRPGTLSGDCSLSNSLPSSSISSSRSLFYTRDQLESLYDNIESNPPEIMSKLVRLCGDNSIEELFKEGLEPQILYALKEPKSHDVTCQFLARIMNSGNHKEVRRAHCVVISKGFGDLILLYQNLFQIKKSKS